MKISIVFIFYLKFLPGCFSINADDPTCLFPLHVDTDDVFSYRFLEIPHGITQIRFDVKANNDVHIGLFPSQSVSTEYYLIVIGSNQNRVSDIRRCGDRPCVDKDEYWEDGIVTQDEFRRFWITFECNGNIAVGKNEDTLPFLQWTDPNPVTVGYMGYSTGWRSTGEFRFCNFAEKHETVSENDVLYLKCELNFVLYIIDAVYGYDCATLGPDTQEQQSCFSENSEQIVSSACNYRRNCTVEASDGVFNSLCTRAQQYLRVNYVCARVPTSVTLTPVTQNVIKGSGAEFTCDVVADELVEPIIKWFFEDTELDPNQRGSEYALIGNNVLRVLAANASHTGTFKCLAETERDQDSATAELVVQAEPNAPYGIELQISGLEATLLWTEPANNNAEIQNYTIEYRTQHDTFPFPCAMAPWAKLRTISAFMSEYTIQMENYLEYSFCVTATNDVGTSEKSDVVTGPMTPAAPPDEVSMPSGVTSEAAEPGMLTVSWDEVHPFHHNGPDFSYVVKWRKEGETEWRTEVLDDPSQTSFDIKAEEHENIEFSVGVRNSVDDGPVPEEYSGTTGQGVPSWVIVGVCPIAFLLTLSGSSFLVWNMIRKWKSRQATATTISAPVTSFQDGMYMSLQTDGIKIHQNENDVPAVTHIYHTMPDATPQVQSKAENEEIYATVSF